MFSSYRGPPLGRELLNILNALKCKDQSGGVFKKRRYEDSDYLDDDAWDLIRSFTEQPKENYLLPAHLKAASPNTWKTLRWLLQGDLDTALDKRMGNKKKTKANTKTKKRTLVKCCVEKRKQINQVPLTDYVRLADGKNGSSNRARGYARVEEPGRDLERRSIRTSNYLVSAAGRRTNRAFPHEAELRQSKLSIPGLMTLLKDAIRHAKTRASAGDVSLDGAIDPRTGKPFDFAGDADLFNVEKAEKRRGLPVEPLGYIDKANLHGFGLADALETTRRGALGFIGDHYRRKDRLDTELQPRTDGLFGYARDTAPINASLAGAGDRFHAGYRNEVGGKGRTDNTGHFGLRSSALDSSFASADGQQTVTPSQAHKIKGFTEKVFAGDHTNGHGIQLGLNIQPKTRRPFAYARGSGPISASLTGAGDPLHRRNKFESAVDPSTGKPLIEANHPRARDAGYRDIVGGKGSTDNAGHFGLRGSALDSSFASAYGQKTLTSSQTNKIKDFAEKGFAGDHPNGHGIQLGLNIQPKTRRPFGYARGSGARGSEFSGMASLIKNTRRLSHRGSGKSGGRASSFGRFGSAIDPFLLRDLEAIARKRESLSNGKSGYKARHRTALEGYFAAVDPITGRACRYVLPPGLDASRHKPSKVNTGATQTGKPTPDFLRKLQRNEERKQMKSIVQTLNDFYAVVNQPEFLTVPEDDEPIEEQSEDDYQLSYQPTRSDYEEKDTEQLRLAKLFEVLKSLPRSSFDYWYHEPFDPKKPWTWIQNFPKSIPRKYLKKFSDNTIAEVRNWQRAQKFIGSVPSRSAVRKRFHNTSAKLGKTENKQSN